MKKNVYGLFLALSLLAAKGVSAVGYTPLVHIPGLPENGTVDISAYLVGIYNFLLSIVGIVAVIMLIIGGMKYITAAGNGAAVTDAKESIKDALLGLALALFSWVIVAQINPDVLYLRQPGALLNKNDTSIPLLGRCFKPFSETNNTCVCKDDTVITGVTDEKNCQRNCLVEDRCSSDANFCLVPGSAENKDDPIYTDKKVCSCKGGDTTLTDNVDSCQAQCLKNGMCGSKFLGISLSIGHGYAPGESDVYRLSSNDGDELWEMTMTNNPLWNGFAVYTHRDSNYSYTNDSGNKFSCAILLTAGNGSFWSWAFHNYDQGVVWVRNGATVGGRSSLRKDLGSDYTLNCEHVDDVTSLTSEFGVTGVCNKATGPDNTLAKLEMVLKAEYSSSIVSKCGACDLAVDGTTGSGDKTTTSKIYQFNSTYKCVNGFWR